MNNPKQKTKGPAKRFDKLVNHIVQKQSPSNNMANEDEADAIQQEGKKRKLKDVDLPEEAFK